MAVYQGARLRAPSVRVAIDDAPRTTALPARRPMPHRTRRAVILVASVVIGTGVAFAYLTQTLGANASQARIDSLAGERDTLEQRLVTLGGLIAQRTTDGLVEAWAADNGLVELGDPLIVELP